MKSIPLLFSLVATLASAQPADAPAAQPADAATAQPTEAPAAQASPTPPPLTPATPSEPPLPPPPVKVTPGATGPAESPKARAVRYSRFSVGSGGGLFAFTEVFSGVVSGAMLGHSFEKNTTDTRENGAYTGAVIGGLALGTAATLYQYYVPVERYESFLATGAACAGLMAGLALGINSDLGTSETAWLTLGTTQLGILSVLALTSGPGDVSAGSAALIGMVSLYAFTLTLLTQDIIDTSKSGSVNYTPTFLAPAAGMVLGALLATQVELNAGRVLKLTLVPIGVGTTMLWLGGLLASGTTVPLTAMAGIVTSFALTLLVTSNPGEPTEREGQRQAELQAMPVPVVMAAGRDHSSLAAGPGLFLRF